MFFGPQQQAGFFSVRYDSENFYFLEISCINSGREGSLASSLLGLQDRRFLEPVISIHGHPSTELQARGLERAAESGGPAITTLCTFM